MNNAVDRALINLNGAIQFCEMYGCDEWFHPGDLADDLRDRDAAGEGA